MRVGKEGITTLKRANTIIMTVLLVLGTFVLAATPPPQEGTVGPTAWPEEIEWINYTFQGEPIRDWEDKPYENDPTHGIANVQPAAVDIASGVDASGGGPENNPGNYTSVQYYYNDTQGDSSGFLNIDDDWLFLRMRVADDPRATGGKYQYKAYHWDILLEVDDDVFSELVVDLNGGGGYYKWGTVGVYYNDTDDYEYDPENDCVWRAEASKENNEFTRTVFIDYDPTTDDDDQWWIEYAIPVTGFTDLNGVQLINKDIEFSLFFSTSASATNPLQKDWMGEYIFGVPANITVEKTVLEDIVSPGDTLHYQIFYNNTGDFKANQVWINDTIPEYTTILDYAPEPDSTDGGVVRWHFTDVLPGNHSVYLNVTVDADVPDGCVLKNVVALNYVDDHNEEKPPSEDETENPVEGPFMAFSKTADRTTADPGDTIKYTLTYTNTGSGGALDVVIVDTLHSQVDFNYSNPSPTSEVGDTLTWEIAYVPGNSTNTIDIYVDVPAGIEDETFLVNHAILNYTDGNQNEYDELEDWANVTVTSPGMSFSKSVDLTEADPGDTLTYTLSYANTGTGDAANVVVTDTIPLGVSFVSSSPGYDGVSGSTYTWNLGTVGGGTNGSISITVTIDAGVADKTVLTNEATLDHDDPNGNPYTQLEDNATTTVTAPIMSFDKCSCYQKANPGDTLYFSLDYENTGTGNATNVIITDALPVGMTFVSSVPTNYSVSGRTYTWNIGTVGPGENGSVQIIVTVDVGIPDGTQLTNKATLDYDDDNGNPYTQLEDEETVTITAPVVSFSKTVDKNEADPGDTLVYTLSYKNTGTGFAAGVIIKDTIPADTTFVNSTPSPDGTSGDTYTWNIGNLAGGAGGNITITVTVDAGVADGTELLNTATLDYADANGNYYPQLKDSATTTVTAPIMSFSKSVDLSSADPGDILTYTLSYTNTGTGDAANVVVKDTIPVGVTFNGSNPGYDGVSGRTFTWNLGTVGASSSGSITITVKINAGVSDKTVLTNEATLDYTDPNGNGYTQLTDDATTTVTAPIMSFSKSVDLSTADPGDKLTYTLAYTNSGTGDAANVVVKDTIPVGVTFDSSNPGYTGVSGRTYTWNLGTVAAGTNGTIIITVIIDAGVADKAVLRNDATLDYTDPNGNGYTQLTDDATTTVTAPIMSFGKTVDLSTADPGDKLTYTLSYANTGTGDAANVVIKDTIPVGVTFDSSNPGHDGVSGRTYTWNIGTVSASSSGSIKITVIINAGVADKTQLKNEATLDYTDPNGNGYTQLTDDATTTVTAPIMSFGKTVDLSTADPGDKLIYTLSYANTGTGDAANVVIKDTIPVGVTFDSSNPGYTGVSGRTYTWNIGTVGAGTNGTIKIVVKINAGIADKTILKNEATLDHTDPNGNGYTQLTDDATTTVTAPILSFSKSVDLSNADPGDILSYTLLYINSGTGDAANAVVKDTIPLGVTFNGSNPGYDGVSGRTYTWNVGTIGAGTNGTITITVKINAGVADKTVLTNEATLDHTDPNGNPYTQLTDDATTTVTAPIMSFSKSVDLASADPGDILTYTLSYANTGTGDAANVVVKDTIPVGVTFNGSNPGYDGVSGRTYTWNLGTVSASSSGSIKITVIINAGVADGEKLKNDATFDHTDPNGNPYTQLKDDATTTVTAPIMSFSKSVDLATGDPGDKLTYTLTYVNSGTGDAANVVVKDTIPVGVTFDGSNLGYDNVSGRTYTWNVGTVSAGTNGSIKITVIINVGVADKTILKNEAILDHTDPNGNPYAQLRDDATSTVTAPVMTFDKCSCHLSADPGDTLVFTLAYKNTGTGIATNVIITDTIPVGMTYNSSNPTHSSVSGRTYTWNVGTVGPGVSGSILVTVTVDVPLPDGTKLTNAATLDYDDANGNPYTQLKDKVTITITAPVLSFLKVVDKNVADPSDTLVYTLSYKNTGSGLATEVVIEDTIPADTTFVNATPSPDGSSGDTYTWNVGNIASGAGGNITITVTVDAFLTDGTNLLNTATLDYADANGNFYPQLNDSASTIVTAPSMTILKTADVKTADPGDTIIYTIEWANSGNGNAKNVEITDTLPDNVTFNYSTPAPDSTVGKTLIWNLGTVGGNSNGTIKVYVIVDVGTPDGTLLTNGVVLEYEDDNNNPQDTEEDKTETTVTAPIMSFSKTASVSKADPGDTIVYNLTYYNSGSGNASDVLITDTLPSGVDLVDTDPPHDSEIGLTLIWNIGLVPGKSGGSIEITVTVKIGVADGTLLHNVAVYNYSDDNGNPYDPLDDDADVTVTAPIMTVSKTADVTKADPSDYITYNITYKNIGTGEATDVIIKDTIPPETTFINSTPGYDIKDGDTYYWNISSLLAGEGGTIIIIVQVDAYTADATLLTNCAKLNYKDANGNPYPQICDQAQVTVTAPDMIITKTANVSDADPGDKITYTLTYTNLGSGSATDVVITDIIPADTTYFSSSPKYDTVSGDTYTWNNINTVGPFGSGIITITVSVDVGVPDGKLLRNNCTLDYDDANGNPYPQKTAFADVTVTAPDMIISKDADVAKADPSDIITYKIDYENLGSGEATDIVVIDTIPLYTTYVNATPAPDSHVGRVLTWKIASVLGGSGGSIKVEVSVDAYTADGELLTNVATLDYDDANGNPYQQEGDSAQTTVTAPVITFSKVANVAKADPGDTIVYTLTYANIGTGEATDIVVTDIIPSDTTYSGSNPTYDGVSGDTYTWNIASLAAGANGTITINVTVDAGVSDGALLHNIGRFDYDDANGNPYPQKESTADVTVTAPVLSITKVADVSVADPEDKITYTIEFTNSGTGNATNVVIADTIPAYTTYVNSTPGYDNVNGSTYFWNFALVKPNETVTITLVLEVDVGTPDETLLHNGVTLDYEDDNGNPLDQEKGGDDVTVEAPVFTFSKVAAVALADPGDTILYTINYKNIGTGWASLVEIVDTIPPDTSFLNSTPGYSSFSGDEYTYTIGNLGPGISGTIKIWVTVDVPTPDETLLHNVAKLDYADANGNYYTPLSDYADVTVTAPILSIKKTANVGDADPGDTIIYTIEYENSGTGLATLVEIVDTIPAATTFVKSTPNYDNVSGDVYTFLIGNLGAKSKGNITIEVTVDVPTPDKALLHNAVVLDWADANGNYYPQLDDFADVKVTAPVMTFSKTADVAFADPDDTIIYTIKYKNWGTGLAKLVEIVDIIPSDTTFVNSNPAPTNSSGDTYIWIIGDLAPGASGTITIEVKVDLQTKDETLLHNTATLDYADANKNPYPQMDDYADVEVTAPILSLTKVADVLTADPGDVIEYTIEYKNSGTGLATLLEIVDTLPDHVTFINATPGYTVSGKEYTWYIGDLNKGEGGTITILVSVNVSTTDKTLLHNQATLDWADANGNYYTQLLAYADVDVTAPVLTFSKKVDLDEASPGTTLVYTLEYENTGSGLATLVEILDIIPADTTFVNATGVYSISGDNIKWTLGNLTPGAKGTITITVTVDVPTDDKTLLHNEAWLEWADSNGNSYPDLYDYADTLVRAPIMTFSKSTTTGTADPGDVLVYTLKYENIGSGLATLVVIEDNIPISHVTLTWAVPMYDNVSGGVYSWYIGDVLPGEKGEITVTVKVDVGVADQTLLHNSGKLYWADANGNYYPPLKDFANVFVTAPVITMSKTANVATADPGDTIIFTIDYVNSGTGTASLVEIVDTIPDHVTFVNATPGYKVSGNKFSWSIGNVSGNSIGSVQMIFTVNVPTPDETLLHNSAILDWADANGNYYPRLSDDAEVIVTAPILSFSKVANTTTAYPNEPIVYTLEYENSGTGLASGVYIIDTIPTDTNFVSATPGYSNVSGNVYTWYIGDVGANVSGKILITVTVKDNTPDTTPLENFATLDWADANGNYYSQLDGYALVTVTAPIIVIDKTADKTSVNPGDYLTFTINYKNIGTGSKWGFEISDTLPVFTSFVDANPWYTSVTNKTYTWYIGEVLPGTDKDIQLTVQIDAYTPDQTIIRNEIGNVFVEVPVTAPDMNITKNANVVKADPGDLIVYTIFYENTGSGNATGVMIKDIIPEHTTFVTSSINYTGVTGRTYEYFIDFVLAHSSTSFTITVRVNPGTADTTLLHNVATLDWADANGNFYPQESDFADVIVTAPIMEMSKDADVSEGTPGDPITYSINYVNLGTGDASSVVLVDILPPEVTYVNAAPAPDSQVGNVLTWNIGDVPSNGSGTITINVYITPQTWDQTVLHNVATLNYSDANDNFIEQLEDDADVVVIAPVMTIDKEGGEVKEEAYIITDIRLRVAGEKWHNVELFLYNNGESVAYAEVYRVPGDPDDQSVTIHNVTINLLDDSFSARVVYTPFDDYVNGEFWGADPAWLILTTQYGSEIRLHHTFNIRHNDTWIWDIDDFRPYLVNLPLTLKYTVSYTIDYANIGTGDATNVWIYDEIPADTSLEFSDPAYDTYIGNIIGWDIGYVPSGASGTILVNISFTFENVIVKNWFPQGKILENTVTMDYHDTNGNLVDQPSDTADVLVYVPSELKKVKTTLYAPIFLGIGDDAPADLMDLSGDSTAIFQNKFLVFFEPKELEGDLDPVSGSNLFEPVLAAESGIVHIYIDTTRYETEPPQEHDMEMALPEIVEPELPEEMPSFETIVIEVGTIEPKTFTREILTIPEIVIFDMPSIYKEGPTAEEVETQVIVDTVLESETTQNKVEITEDVEIEETESAKETQKISTEIIKAVEEKEEIEEGSASELAPQHSASIETGMDSRKEALVSAGACLSALLFAVIILALTLVLWFERRKRRY